MLKKIKNIKNNKEAKNVIENLFSLSVLQIVNYILPFITIPYLAKILGVENFGILAFSNAVIVFFMTFTDYGFNYTAVRDIAKNKDDYLTVSKIFYTVMFSRFILMIISFFILLILMYVVPSLKEYRTILMLTFLTVPGYTLFPEWFFQAMEKMKYISIINLVTKSFFTFLTFIVVVNENDYYYVPILNACGFFLSGIFAVYYINKKFNITFYKPKVLDIKLAINKSSNMFLSLFLPNLYTNFSTILLGFYGGKIPVGIYDGGNKFISVSQQFTNVLSRAFYPFLARRLDKHKLYEYISFTISIITSLIFFFLADTIVSFFFTDEFKDSAKVLKIMSLSPIFLFMMNAYGTNYLVLINKENILRNIILFCSVFGMILSYIMVSNYSFIGAAITITVIWALRGTLTMYFAKKYKKILKYENSIIR